MKFLMLVSHETAIERLRYSLHDALLSIRLISASTTTAPWHKVRLLTLS